MRPDANWLGLAWNLYLAVRPPEANGLGMDPISVRNLGVRELQFYLMDDKRVKGALRRDYINRQKKLGKTVHDMNEEVREYKRKLRKKFTGLDDLSDMKWTTQDVDPSTGKPRNASE